MDDGVDAAQRACSGSAGWAGAEAARGPAPGLPPAGVADGEEGMGVRFRWRSATHNARARTVAGLSAFWLILRADGGARRSQGPMPLPAGLDRMVGARCTYPGKPHVSPSARGEPVKMSKKIAAAAAAGALLLTGGLTAAANAGTTRRPPRPRCPPSMSRRHRKPWWPRTASASAPRRRGQGSPRQVPGGQAAVRHGGPGGPVRNRSGAPSRGQRCRAHH